MNALIAIITSLISFVVTAIVWKLRKHNFEEQKDYFNEISQLTHESFTNQELIDEKTPWLSLKNKDELWINQPGLLWKEIGNQTASIIALTPNLDEEEIKKEIETKINTISERISKIESRFPEEAKLEKIASINDALLCERIDQLNKQIEILEKKSLTKWDVVIVVSAIIGGIAFVVGAMYGILKALNVI